MTLTYVLMQNLKRNPLRTGLTAVAFALPMAVFVGAISFVAAFVALSAAMEKELRLGVHAKTTIINMLPEGMRGKIEGLDPQREKIAAVCGMRWFGGRVPDTPNTLTSLAADADTFPQVYPDVGMTESEIAAWHKERRAAAAGQAIMERHGWKLGDRVTLESTVPPYLELEFVIVKIITNPQRNNIFYFRRDYLQESRKQAGVDDPQCNIFWVKCNSLSDMHALQAEIDALFANSPNETKTEDENAFFANFTQASGNIPGLMQTMAITVIFIVALIAGNTMAMSFRERIRELAVFKAIGFPSSRVFFVVLAESVALSLGGALLGVLPMSVWLAVSPVQLPMPGPIGKLHLSIPAVAVSLLMALVVGVVSGIGPAWQAMKLRSVDALRRVN